MNYTRNLIQVGLVIALLSLLLFPSIGRSDTVSQSLNLAVSQTPDSFSFVPTDIKGLRKRLGLESPPPPESRERGKLGIGLSLGPGEYRGDRGGGTVKPGNEFHLEYQWEESPYSLRGGISRGELKDAAFSTKTTSFDLVTLYQLRKIKIKEVTPYLFAGLGWLNFEGKDIYQETLTSGSVVISLGAGIFYPIRDRLKLYLEGGYHFTASDELDWLTEDSNNDGYWRLSLGVTHYPPEKSEVRSQESGVRSQKSEEVSADSTPVVVQPTEPLVPLVIPQADEGADTAVSQEPAGEAAPMADSDTEAVSPAITEPTPEIVDSVEPPDSLVTPQVDEKPDTTISRKVEGEAAPTVKPDTGATFPATAEPTPGEADEPAKPTIPSATPPPGEEPDKTRDLPPTKPAETSDSPPLQAPQIAGLPKEPGPALPEPMPKQKSLSELTQIQLPFESQLKIDVNLALNAGLGYAQWTKDKDRVNNPLIGFSSGLDFDQTIKAIVKGNIGPKVNVNMDYNPDAGFGKDKTKISISYTGDHDEIVQEAAFGDVSLTLPQTKFINYGNKKVFGLKGQAKYEDFSLIAVGSKTEGTSPPPKPLKGKKAAMETIPTQTENSFQKRKYYRLMAEKTAEERDQLLPVIKDSLEILLGGQERQFYDDRPDRTTAGEITAGHWENKDSFSGKFYRLIPGEDYLIDHKTGIVTFKRNIYDRDVLAVYFKTRDSREYGTASSPVIIKQTTGAGSSITNLYEDYELKNRFFLSSRTEVMYLSSLDLEIEIKDKYGNAYYDVNKNNNKEQDEEYYLKIFGLDKDNDGRIDEDALEYLKDEGLLLFPDPTPFDLTDANSTQNPFYQEHQNDAKWSNEWARLSRRSIYKYIPDKEKVDEPTYSINISYKKKGKTNTYSLNQFGIIEGSVRVFVNKELKNPVKDYQVDYNSGQIIFTNDEDVKENDDILVYYDVGGYGKQETLAGLRGEYKPVENFSLGSTYIFKGASPENKVPKINETIPRLQVLDMNAEVNAAPGLNRALDLLNLPVANRLSLNAAGEAAASFSTPAAGHDVAIIDSLDGGGGEGATLFLPGEYNWSLGSLPPNDKRAMLLYKDKPYSERPGPYDNDRKDYGHVQILNPDENERETTKYLLALAYNSPEDNHWASIMRCIKSDGADYSENDYIRAWVKGLEEGEELWIDLGNVSEDADGQGGYQEVVLDERGDTLWNIGEPKTEERNKNRRNIFNSEDIGWEFIDEDNDTVTRVGTDNYGDKTTPDSEDLDENGKLNTEESYYSFKLESGAPPDARGWVLYQIPRTLDTMTKGAPDWTAVKYIRLRLKCKEGKRDPDNPIFIESIEMVKSDWTESDTAGISLSDKHNERNPDYRETYETQLRNDGWFRDLDTDGKDGAMVIEYDLDGNDSSSCYQTIRAGSDKYGNYKNLAFWLYRASGGGASTTFHFQLGSEADDNFFRYSFPLSDSSDDFKELSRQGLINITDIKGESTWNFPREEWRRVIINLDLDSSKFSAFPRMNTL
ncbi:MAG: outer membrane beta-barrel protein [bacterium]|nr:outer membrane beta-barrel protein [bacterium]